jgi:hypothetical protein
MAATVLLTAACGPEDSSAAGAPAPTATKPAGNGIDAKSSWSATAGYGCRSRTPRTSWRSEQLDDPYKFAYEVLKPDSNMTKGTTTVIDGTPAVAIESGDSTLYVATTGRPYPIKLVPKNGKPGEELAFFDYDAPLDLTPPGERGRYEPARPLRPLHLQSARPDSPGAGLPAAVLR